MAGDKPKTVKDYREAKNKEEKAVSFYVSQGWTPEQSYGIVGNLLRESALNQNAVGDGGNAFGLAQWHPDRQAKAKKLYGEDWKSFDNQLKFVDWELKNSEKDAGDKLRASTGAWQAGQIISDYYERPKVKYSSDKTRQQHVNNLSKRLAGVTIAPPTEEVQTPTFDQYVKPYMSDVKQLDIPKSSATFAGVSDAPEEKETPKKSAETEKVQQQTNEYNFLEELNKGQEALMEHYKNQNNEDAQPQYQLPQTDVLQVINDVNQFVDTPVAQQGLRKPIYVDSKNDPRYRAYQDSLIAHTNSQKEYKNIKKSAKLKDLEVDLDSEKSLPYKKFIDEYGYNDKAFNVFNSGTNKYMKPQKISHFRGEGITGFLDYGNQALFKKPQQQVIVQDTRKPNTTTGEQVKENNNRGMVLNETFQPKPRPKVEELQQIQPIGIQNTNQSIESELPPLRQITPQPKYYNITDKVNQNFGGSETNYKWFPENGIPLQELSQEKYEDGTPYNERKMIPIYQQGGDIMTRRDSLDLQRYSQKKNREMEQRGFVLQNQELGTYPNVHSLNLQKLEELKNRQKENKVTQVINDKGYREPKVYNPNVYQRPVTENKYFNQETDIGVLDPKSSYMLFDKRANPTEKSVWMNPSTGDGATTYGYEFGEKYNPKPINKNRITPPKKPINTLTALNQPINYMQSGGGIPISKDGMYEFPNQKVIVPSTRITMENISHPILAITDKGQKEILEPNGEYQLNGNSTLEIPLTENEKRFLEEIKKRK